MTSLAHWKKVAKSGSFNHKQVGEMYRMYRKGHVRFGGKFEIVKDKVNELKKGIMGKLTLKSSKLARLTPSRTTDPYTLGKVFDIINNTRRLEQPGEKAEFDRRATEADEGLTRANTRKALFFQTNPEFNDPGTLKTLLMILGHFQLSPTLANFMKEKWTEHTFPQNVDWVKEAYDNRVIGKDGYVIDRNAYPLIGHNWVKGNSQTDSLANNTVRFLVVSMPWIVNNQDVLTEYRDILKEIGEASAELRGSKKIITNELDIMAKEVELYKPNHAVTNFPSRALSKLSNVFNHER